MWLVRLFNTNLFTLTFLYFIQGLPYGFQSRFMPIYLRSQGVSHTAVGLFKLLLAPWLCKALWAPLVDRVGTKHQWLVGSIAGLAITCALSSLVPQDCLTPLCIVIFLLNVCAATQDIAVDGMAVAMLSSDEIGLGNTAQVVGYKVGSIFGGGILVWFLDYIGWIGLFSLLSLLYVEALLFVYMSPRLRNFKKLKHASSGKKSRKKESSDEKKELENDGGGDEKHNAAGKVQYSSGRHGKVPNGKTTGEICPCQCSSAKSRKVGRVVPTQEAQKVVKYEKSSFQKANRNEKSCAKEAVKGEKSCETKRKKKKVPTATLR